MIRIFAALTLFAMISISAPTARAHPHVWIDMKSSPLFNDKGEITGLSLTWLFGDFYSAFIMEEIPKNADGTPMQAALEELAKGNLANLAEYNYYTNLRIDDQTAALKPVDQYTTGILQNRLWMKFQVDLKTPVDPLGKSISYAIYDPSYYIEILHDNKAPALTIDGAMKERCTARLIPPTPPEDMSMMALGLDKTEKPDFALGEFFAEWVSLKCK